MPKIPTFDTRIRRTALTEQAPSLRTDIRATGQESTLLRIQDDLQREVDYYSRKKKAEQDLESRKIVLEIGTDADKIVQSVSNNPEEDTSINIYNEKINPLVEKRLAKIKNRNVRKLVKKRLEILNLENTGTIKKNSHAAFLKSDTETYNNEQNILLNKYKTADPGMKIIYLRQMYDKAESRNETHILGAKNLTKEKQRINSLILSSDAGTFSLLENGEKQINQRDKDLGTINFLSDEDFGVTVYNAYSNNIESLTVVGSEDADFDQAKILIGRLKNFKRGDRPIATGELKDKIATLEQKILTEEIRHEAALKKSGDNKRIDTYTKGQKKALEARFFNAFDNKFNKAENRQIATEALFEFDTRLAQFNSSNPNATTEQQLEFTRNLSLDLQNKYEDANIEKTTTYNLSNNRFNIIREENDFSKLVQDYQNKDTPTPPLLISLARLNGYFQKDAKGNETKKPDVGAFINAYRKILKQRKGEE
tara:strand:- start:166 stop:1608 length:1443 start_codon:yes stop_codon:yes gene_type:complete